MEKERDSEEMADPEKTELDRQISKRLRVEKALRASEERFRNLIENSGDVIYMRDANGNFTYVNPVCERLTGYTPEELLGKRFTKLILPAMREETEAFYLRQFTERTPESYREFIVLTRSGEEKWVSQVVSLLAEERRVKGFHAVVRNITKRKRAEEALQASEKRYRSLIENLPVPEASPGSGDNEGAGLARPETAAGTR